LPGIGQSPARTTSSPSNWQESRTAKPRSIA
jgi:hypothetical protein